MKPSYVLRSDAGHGWLMISPSVLASVGLSEADISRYSYRSPDGTLLALEEDCDAGTFLQAVGKEFDIRHIDDGMDSPIRDWPRYGTKTFDW